MKKMYLFLLIFSFSLNAVRAQTHTQMWLRASVFHDFNQKISGILELNHRTQSDAHSESPFRYPLCNAVRIWINYKLSKNETLNFSPYAFFSNDPVVNKVGDELKPNANEHRIQIQYESKYPLTKKWSIRNREGLEYRVFETNSNLLRFRLREGIAYQLNPNWNFQIYDELFLNTLQTENGHMFDQNRVGIQGTYSLNSSIKFDLGSNWMLAKPRTSDILQTNYMFYINWQLKL